MESNKILLFVYEQLRGQYPLHLGSSLELDGFTKDFLVLYGTSSLGFFDIYHDGEMFVFEANYSLTELYPHWHPETAEEIMEDVKNFMDGRRELLDGLDI